VSKLSTKVFFFFKVNYSFKFVLILHFKLSYDFIIFEDSTPIIQTTFMLLFSHVWSPFSQDTLSFHVLQRKEIHSGLERHGYSAVREESSKAPVNITV